MVVAQVWWASWIFVFYVGAFIFGSGCDFIQEYSLYKMMLLLANHLSIYCLTLTAILVYSFISKKNWIIPVGWRAGLLSLIFMMGLQVLLVAPAPFKAFGLYMMVMAFFHFSEFISIGIVRPREVTADSFVLNHSPEYAIAAVTSWGEYLLGVVFFPDLKVQYYVSLGGFTLCIVGELLRKLAIFTAGRNFHHLVQTHKAKDHTLVTTGVYSLFRHPSYVGWFYWAVGTQIILLNPFCIPAYALASWTFFKSRVYVEEITLVKFFGQDYIDYRKKVGTGLPFINGYEP